MSMSRAQLIPLGAGVVAALLHLSVTLGSPGAPTLMIFSQAPIAATGLALGFMPAAVAAAFAAILVAIGSPTSGGLTLYITVSAIPILLIVYFALKSDRPENHAEEKTQPIEWYPVGKILGSLAAYALAVIFVSFLTFIGSEAEVRELINAEIGVLTDVLRGLGATPQAIDQAVGRMVLFVPSTLASFWFLLSILNAVLAQRILTSKGRNIRPKPDYSQIEAPIWLAAAIILGISMTFIVGNLRFLGINVLFVASIPFFFIGLAVLHSISAAWPGRLFLLVGAYLFLVLLVWPAAIIALLGILEYWLRLRDRMQARHSNKGNE